MEYITSNPHLQAVHDAQLAYSDAFSERLATVVKARIEGASWEQIGDALGLTKQGAWEQFHRIAP